MSKSRTAYVQYDEATDEYIIPLPQDMCDELGWKTDDVLNWSIDQETGAIHLTKKKKLFVVDTVVTYRMRYVLEDDCAEYAMDTVTMEEAVEFSQQCLGEQISDVREVTEDQVIELCDKDNEYLKNWTREMKLEKLVTRRK